MYRNRGVSGAAACRVPMPSEVPSRCPSLGIASTNVAAMCLAHNSDRVSRKPNHVRVVGYAKDADRRFSSDVFEDSGFNSVDGDQVVRVDIDYDQLVAPPYYQVSLNLQEAVMNKIRRLESIGVLRKQFSEFRSPLSQ